MNLLIHVDSLQRLRFFLRLEEAMLAFDVSVTYVTTLPAVAFRAVLRGKAITIVRGQSGKEFPAVESCFDVLSGELTIEEAIFLYSSMWQTAVELVDKNQIDACLIWNGCKTADLAVYDVVESRNLNALFLEVGNLPGKLFVDCLGVNARSSIARYHAVLEDYPADGVDFQRWLSSYLKSKRGNSSVPQKKTRVDFGLNKLLNRFFCFAGRLPKTQSFSIFRHLKRELGLMRYKVPLDSLKSIPKYVFFPLQVTKDTQLVVNSDLDNESGIRAADEYARNLNVPLVVKLHPAEDNPGALNQIEKLREELKFYVVEEPVVQLIERAELVVTLNSTVGLEAKLMAKPLVTLSPTYYSSLRAADMKNLVLAYMLDIDYFAKTSIDVHVVSELLQRLEGSSRRREEYLSGGVSATSLRG